jgi:hypothetical protein
MTNFSSSWDELRLTRPKTGFILGHMTTTNAADLLAKANTDAALFRLQLSNRKVVWVEGLGYLAVPPGYDESAITADDLKYDTQVCRLSEKALRKAVR